MSVNSSINSVYEIRTFLYCVCRCSVGAEYWLVYACVYVLQNRTLELEANRKEKNNSLDIHIFKYKQ